MLPVYVINLDRRPDRMEFMAAQLGALGLPFERISAVDAQAASDDLLGADTVHEGQWIRVGRGGMALMTTTLRLYEHIAQGSAPAALICEDDVALAADLPALLASADWLPDRTHLVQLEAWGRKPSRKLFARPVATPIPGRALHPLRSRTSGTACYLITREGAAHVAALPRPHRVPIDHLLFSPNVSSVPTSLGLAMMLPAMAAQKVEDFPSDIAAQRRRKPLSMRLRRLWLDINLVPQQSLSLLTGRSSLIRVTCSLDRPAP